ncbi:hypothetical protein V3C99_013811 [Haemonchus contortus]
MRLLGSCSQLLLAVLALHIRSTNSEELQPTESRNDLSRGKTSSEAKKVPTDAEDFSKNGRESEQTVSPVFVKNLNQALVKFLRDVSAIVKELPQDAEQIQKSDIEKIIANSLIAAVPVNVMNAVNYLRISLTS